jgi:DNA (cytosine-5)-methyltransferase 1
VGVDIKPQPNYCGDGFYCASALEVLRDLLDGGSLEDGRLGDFDAIHASPPCQAYSRATAWSGNRSAHPDLIAPVQRLLRDIGLPYVIENVQEARQLLHHPLMLCGTGLGLPVRRHRYFELPWWPHPMMTPCLHRSSDFSHDHGTKQTESVYA